MKSFLKFILVFSGILLLSAFLAPLLFKVLPFKFERIFNRLVMIFSLAAIVFFVRIRKQDLKNAGLIDVPRAKHFFLFSFASGFGILILLMFVKKFFGMMNFNPMHLSAGGWVLRVLGDLFAALLIGVLEECFFRGFIFGRLKSAFRGAAAPAVITASVFYSILHFLHGKRPFIGPDPVFKDGLKLVFAPLNALADWPAFWPAAVGLFIFGVVLNLLYLRTRSLYAPIGLHAGCVFFVKLDGLFADSLGRNTLFWGSSKLYDGVMGWIFIAVLGAFLLMLLKPQTPNRS